MNLPNTTLFIVVLVALPSLLLAQMQEDAWKIATQQEGITTSYHTSPCGDDNMLLLKVEKNNAQTAVVYLALEREENGAKAGIPAFHLQVDAHGASIMDCQELGPHSMRPMMVENEAAITVNISHLHVCLS